MNTVRIFTTALAGAMVIGLVALGAGTMGCGSGMGGNGGTGGGGGGGTTTMTSSSTKVEQINGQCVQNPQVLTGSKNQGESCSQATDCKPTCCQCGNGKSNTWLGSECSNGSCANPCADTVGDADCSM